MLISQEVVTSEHRVAAQDGVSLYVRELCPAASAERTLVCVHGACGHGGRLGDFPTIAAANGWRVLVPDLRGHGRSEGVPVHVSKFAEYVHDLDSIWQHFECDPARTAILGHSTGGLIAARFAVLSAEPSVPFVLLSPFFRLRIAINPFVLAFGKVMAVVAPRTRFRSRIQPEELSRDPAAQEEVRADPLIHRSVTAGWFVAAERAMQAAFATAAQVEQPLLVLQGTADRIVNPDATVEWAEATSSRDRTIRVYPGHLHELLREPDRQETIKLILDWLETRVPSNCAERFSPDD